MKHAILVLIALSPFFAAASPAAASQPPAAQVEKKLDPAKEKAIRKLLALSRADEAGEMILEGMIESLRRSMPSVPDSFWKEFDSKKVLASFTEDLVRIYDKHLTTEEINAIITFYESPLGKRALEKMRDVSMDSSKAGQEFSSEVLRQVMNEAEAKGVLPKAHGH